MEAPLEVQVTLACPAIMAGEEPEEPVFARVRLKHRPEMAVRPRVDLCFVLDASASMHRFVLDPQQRAQWQTRAEQRGEITRQRADGRTGMVWTGQTLRELQQHVSTPMLSTLRGVWRTLETLEPADMISVLAFADRDDVIYQDSGSEKAPRLAEAKAQLTRLGSGVDESGLGRGTRLEGALRHGLERLAAEADLPILRRMILVSDGIIQDYETCRPLLDWAVDRGIVISVIGVADEFDEEFLMTVADLTRGNYYYAPTAPEVEQAVRAELEVITRVVGRQGSLRVFPENGCIIQDVYPVSPALSEFQAVWVENGGWRFRIGDISAAQDPEFLVALAPGSLPPGEARLGTVRVEGSGAVTAGYFYSDTAMPVLVTDDARLIQARDDEVMDSVRKLEVYRLERRAAEAAGRGDQDASTRALRAATRALKAMGREDLATEMDAAADASETGTRDLSLTKRVKAGTRRLGSR